MTHTVIIVEQGTGEGGTAKTTVEWQPSHDIGPVEEANLRNRAAKLAKKINDVLYERDAADD